MTSRLPAGTSIRDGMNRMPTACTATRVVSPVAGAAPVDPAAVELPATSAAGSAATPAATASTSAASPAAGPPRARPHAIRHATIFGALDAVRPGGGLVLIATHDPLPLLAQVEQRTPGVFAVDYLERGPQDWRLQFVRGA